MLHQLRAHSEAFYVERQKKKNQQTIKKHQIHINLIRHPQIAPFRFQKRYLHPLSCLALCVLPQNRTLGPRF